MTRRFIGDYTDPKGYKWEIDPKSGRMIKRYPKKGKNKNKQIKRGRNANKGY